MSLGLWCSDVELGHSGRRRGEGQVEMCRADGPGAVKGGREAWTDGPGGRVTGYSGWHLGHRQEQVYMGVIVLTKSRRRTRVERGSGGLGGLADRGRWWHVSSGGKAYGVRYSRRVSRVWASKPGRRSRCGWMARGSIGEIASERGYRWEGAVAVGFTSCRVGLECLWG